MMDEAAQGRPRRRRLPSYGGMLRPIARPRLSQEVRRQLLELISDGRIPANARVFEADLARQLGVSRTPLHEAMASLERDGLVESLGRKGWRVASLSEADTREVYPVLCSLESLVVTLANTSVLGILDELRELSDRISVQRTPARERLSLEGEWHALILAQCPNRTLVETTRSLLLRATRLELACIAAGWPRLAGEIPGITENLSKGEFRAAARFVEMHWRDHGESVASFFRAAADEGDEPEPISGAA